MRRLLGNDRNRLNGRGAGADDGDALAGEIDALMRPVAGMIVPAFEPLEAGKLRKLRRGQAASRHDAELRRDPLAATGGDSPSCGRLVVSSFRHSRVEFYLPPQIESIRDMIDVTENFRLAGITLAPAP